MVGSHDSFTGAKVKDHQGHGKHPETSGQGSLALTDMVSFLPSWWPLSSSNLETIVSFPGGESLQAFVLVTVLVEKAAAPGIKVILSLHSLSPSAKHCPLPAVVSSTRKRHRPSPTWSNTKEGILVSASL